MDRPHVALLLADRPGSIARARAIIRHLGARVTVLRPPSPVELDVPVDAVPLPPPGGAGLLTLDLDHLGPAATERIVAWVDEHRPALVLVDGLPSTLRHLASETGVPTVGVRRPTPRRGGLQRELDRLVSRWIAPYPAAVEVGTLPAEVRRRTAHVGFLSPHEGTGLGRSAARRRLDLPLDGRHVTIVSGIDGRGPTADDVLAAADVAPVWTFSVLGPCEGVATAASSSQVSFEGWSNDPLVHLAAADAIVAGAALSSIADAAAVRRPLALVLPSEGTDERRHLAHALEELGAVAVLDAWPPPIAWPALLAELLDQSTLPLSRLADGRAAKRAADWIDGWATSDLTASDALATPASGTVLCAGDPSPTAGTAATANGTPTPAIDLDEIVAREPGSTEVDLGRRAEPCSEGTTTTAAPEQVDTVTEP
jgi:hypothetical protein